MSWRSAEGLSCGRELPLHTPVTLTFCFARVRFPSEGSCGGGALLSQLGHSRSAGRNSQGIPSP